MDSYFSKERTLQRWEATRKAGRLSYIVKYGVLGWGIPVAIATTVIDGFQGTPVSELGVALAIRLVLFGIVGGLGFGTVMWKFSERARAKAIEKLQASN